MPSIVFPVSSAPGASPQEGAGRLINCYATKTDQGNRSPFKWLRSAGLRELLAIPGYSHCRGFIFVNNTLLVVLDTRVWSVTLSGTVFTATNLGALAGTDTVTIARNQRAGGPDIAAVCAAGTFNLFTGSAPTAFADADWPSVNSITSANGYMVGSTGGGQIWATDLNAVTVNGASFGETQMTLRRVVFFRGELFAFGDTKTKVFEETGDIPFPFRYKKIELPHGICGTHAIAGYEDGWAGGLFWVGEDNIVGQLNGYARNAISSDDVSRAIATATDRTLIECSVYMNGQNAFLTITSPGEWTWEYNVTTQQWNERASYLQDDWRARRSVKAWSRWIVGDNATGKLAEVDPTYRFEFGSALTQHMESGDNANFPYGLVIPAIFLDYVAGEGVASGSDPIETNPQVMISWSLDGGRSWSSEVSRALGQQGVFGKQVRVNRVGVSKGKGFRVRARVSDPVNATFIGGSVPDLTARAP